MNYKFLFWTIFALYIHLSYVLYSHLQKESEIVSEYHTAIEERVSATAEGLERLNNVKSPSAEEIERLNHPELWDNSVKATPNMARPVPSFAP